MAPTSSYAYGRLVRGGLAVAAMAGLAWIASPRPAAPPPALLDWVRVASIARRVARTDGARADDPTVRPADVVELTARYGAMVRRSEDAIAEYLGIRLPGRLPNVHVFDRVQWIDANVANFELLFRPVEEIGRELLGANGGTFGAQVTGGVNRLLLSSQLGLLLGYLSRRILGQYDLALLGREPITSGRLYFVEPNIARLERAMGLDPAEFRQWIALHETTHAFEFEANPWLRDHLNGLLTRYFATLGRDIIGLRGDAPGIGGLIRRVVGNARRVEYSLELIMTPEQREIFRSLQALMCVLEGYSNHVMDRVGRTLLRSYAPMKRRFEQRLARKGIGERMLAKITGLDVKLEQYVLGEKFVGEVVARRGIDVANRVWQGPHQLPTLEEVRQPAAWIARLEGRRAT